MSDWICRCPRRSEDEAVAHVAFDVVFGHDAVAAEDLQRARGTRTASSDAVLLHQRRELAQRSAAAARLVAAALGVPSDLRGGLERCTRS